MQKLVKEFVSVCKGRNLAANTGKRKVMRIGKNREQNVLNIQIDNARMEKVDCYMYLGVDISSDGGMNEEMIHRIREAKKASSVI